MGDKVMRMLSCVVVLAATLSAVPALGQEDISLIGTWTGQRERIAKDDGYREGLATLVITEQKGRTFVGSLNRSNTGGDVKENLWGAFAPGGSLIVGADEEGTYAFHLMDLNTLDYCYTEAGSTARAVCARLVRQK
jgi:hypothetical protein